MQKYRLYLEYDHQAENPLDGSTFKLHSFSSRHINFTHPDNFTERECPKCEGSGILDAETDCTKCEGYGYVNGSLADNPEVLATLSYYEHGLCRWMVGPSTVPDHGGFDTVNVAGVITFNENASDEDRAWFYDFFTEDQQREALEQVAEEYTAWCNGECYGYRLVKLNKCESCGAVSEEEEDVDSCWGFVGGDYFKDVVKNNVLHAIDLADVDVRGEAEYVL